MKFKSLLETYRGLYTEPLSVWTIKKRSTSTRLGQLGSTMLRKAVATNNMDIITKMYVGSLGKTVFAVVARSPADALYFYNLAHDEELIEPDVVRLGPARAGMRRGQTFPVESRSLNAAYQLVRESDDDFDVAEILFNWSNIKTSKI